MLGDNLGRIFGSYRRGAGGDDDRVTTRIRVCARGGI